MEVRSVGNLDILAETLTGSAADLALRLVVALLIYLIGRFVIRKIISGLSKMKNFGGIDTTARGFILNFVKAVLYVALAVSIIAELGVPMSSVIAVIASAGVAIGMGMQGALANIAGGIMLLIFRPFNVGDYIVTPTGEEGYVKGISLVYTVLRTFDNRIISMPNGGLMNANISNTTAEPMRRVDLKFDIASSEPPEEVRRVVMNVIDASEFARKEPSPQVVPLSPVTDGMTYAVRVWTDTSKYWNLYEQLTEEISVALNNAEMARPATPVRVVKEV